MARHKRIHSPDSDEPGLDISSLIDVCFLLLIYFLVTTQIVKKEQELSSTIPTPNLTSPPSHISALHLVLQANGHIFIRNEANFLELIETDPDLRQLHHLSKRLKLHNEISQISGQKSLVKISADGDTAQQRVIDVLNALAGAHISDITFVEQNPA